VSGDYHNVSLLIDSNIGREVMKGKRAFDEIQFRIQHEVNTTVPKIKEAIQRAGKISPIISYKFDPKI
jgi:hypothetical protein